MSVVQGLSNGTNRGCDERHIRRRKTCLGPVWSRTESLDRRWSRVADTGVSAALDAKGRIGDSPEVPVHRLKELTMNLPVPSPTGHLYAYMMVLGTFIVVAASWACGMAYSSHDAKLAQHADKVFAPGEGHERIRAMWSDILVSSKRNTEQAFAFFALVIALATGTTVLGAIMWFLRIQRPEDRKRELEYEKLSLEVAELKKAKNQLLVS